MALIFLLFEQGVPHSPSVLGPADYVASPVSGRRQREMSSMCLKKSSVITDLTMNSKRTALSKVPS